MRSAPYISLVATLTVCLAACQPEPRPLQYGLDACDHCRMTLSDERYGGEMVMSTGKIYTFDSVECLAAFRITGDVNADHVHDMHVVDYGQPGVLMHVAEARFLRSTQLLSPMGANITAFARDQDARGARDVFGGDLLTWSQVLDVVEKEWLPRTARGHRMDS